MKRILGIFALVIVIAGMSSCKKCWECVDNQTQAAKYSLCNDDQSYSSAYYTSWEYLCQAEGGTVRVK